MFLHLVTSSNIFYYFNPCESVTPVSISLLKEKILGYWTEIKATCQQLEALASFSQYLLTRLSITASFMKRYLITLCVWIIVCKINLVDSWATCYLSLYNSDSLGFENSHINSLWFLYEGFVPQYHAMWKREVIVEEFFEDELHRHTLQSCLSWDEKDSNNLLSRIKSTFMKNAGEKNNRHLQSMFISKSPWVPTLEVTPWVRSRSVRFLLIEQRVKRPKGNTTSDLKQQVMCALIVCDSIVRNISWDNQKKIGLQLRWNHSWLKNSPSFFPYYIPSPLTSWYLSCLTICNSILVYQRKLDFTEKLCILNGHGNCHGFMSHPLISKDLLLQKILSIFISWPWTLYD